MGGPNKMKKKGASQNPNLKTSQVPPVKKKEKIDVTVHETIEVDPDLSNEEIESKAKSVVGNTKYTLVMRGTERHIMNTGGSKLLEELGSLRADVKSLQLDVEKREADVKSLQSNVEKHEAGFQALLDVRERAFLTWLRDFWRDHGAGSKAGPSMPFKARIQSLNQSIIHGGYAIVDALMVKQKRLPYEEEFTELYGLSLSGVEYIGNVAFILPEELPIPISLLLMPILAAKQYNAILQVLNAVGTFRFAGWYLRKPEKEIYDRVVMLARERRWEEAEQAATDFPFVPGFVQLQNVDGED